MARKQRKKRQRRSDRRRNFIIGTLFLLALGGFLYRGLPSFATSIAVLVPPETEQHLGKRMIPTIIAAFTGKKNDQNIDDLRCTEESGITALGALTAPVHKEARSHVPFHIHVIDDEIVNAAALPGGHILLFRGMIDFVETEEELAAILAHEAAHITARHPIENMIAIGGASLMFSLIMGESSGGALLVGVAQLLITNGYSQQAETEADTEALRMLADAGISPAALGSLMSRIADEDGDLTGVLSYLSTHPSSAERAERAYATASDETNGPLLSEAQWLALKNVCGEPDDDESDDSEAP